MPPDSDNPVTPPWGKGGGAGGPRGVRRGRGDAHKQCKIYASINEVNLMSPEMLTIGLGTISSSS